LDKIFSIKSKSAIDASQNTASKENSQPETEVSASENVDLNIEEKNESTDSQEESSPKVSRDDADDDKIKFKR
jgi:hypothetical protein